MTSSSNSMHRWNPIDFGHVSSNGHPPGSHQAEVDAFDELKALVLGDQPDELAELRTEIIDAKGVLTDEAIESRIRHLIPNAFERSVRETPDELVEILYPILGPMVQRMIGASMRNLVERIDSKLRKTFNFGQIVRRYKARAQGLSDAEVLFRESMPFQIREIFLIHYKTGLLLSHATTEPDAAHDSDIISAMLTAIGDFVRDAFGRDGSGDLGEIQYGDQRILIEMFQQVYVAVVVEGIEPFDYRQRLQDKIREIERRHTDVLHNYTGDASSLSSAWPVLQTLLENQELESELATAR